MWEYSFFNILYSPLSAITAACFGFFMVGFTRVGLRVGVLLLATFLIQSNLKACRVVTELPLSWVYNTPVLRGLLPFVWSEKSSNYRKTLQGKENTTVEQGTSHLTPHITLEFLVTYLIHRFRYLLLRFPRIWFKHNLAFLSWYDHILISEPALFRRSVYSTGCAYDIGHQIPVWYVCRWHHSKVKR